MEEPKAPVAAPQTSLPPNITKKRPLDYDSNSNYFKIRAVIRDLRPHFIQVLQTPDYKNCKASHEIREQLKIVMKLCDNMKVDVVPLEKSKNTQDGQNSDHHKAVQEKQPQQAEVYKTKGTYIIGGSAFGWNFITFSGDDPVFYGRTKEQFRSAKTAE